MRILLFSNCKKSSDVAYAQHIGNLNITNNDKLVFLNHCRLLMGYKYFNRFNNKIAILRAYKHHGLTGFFGEETVFRNPGTIDEVFLFDHKGENITLRKGTKDGASSIVPVHNEWLKDYIDKTGLIPTTGFAAIFLLQDILGINKNDITLVNFYGSADNSTSKCTEHDWKYEEKWIASNMKRVFV